MGYPRSNGQPRPVSKIGIADEAIEGSTPSYPTIDKAENYVLHNKNYGYVYCLFFPNGKQYVGQSTKSWQQRWRRHKSKRSCCVALKNAINKYGKDNIFVEIIDFASNQKQLDELETKYILQKNTLSPNGYNLKIKTEKIVFTQIVKDKIRNSLNKFWHSKQGYIPNQVHVRHKKVREYCNRNYDDGINIVPILCVLQNLQLTISFDLFLYWKKLRNEIKAKKRESFVNKQKKRKIFMLENNKIYDGFQEIINEFPKLNKHSICKCCNGFAKSHNNYHFCYLENKEAFLRNINNKQRRQYNGKKVMCIQTNKIYQSLQQVKRITGINHISDCCNGKRKTAGKFHWKFI